MFVFYNCVEKLFRGRDKNVHAKAGLAAAVYRRNTRAGEETHTQKSRARTRSCLDIFAEALL